MLWLMQTTAMPSSPSVLMRFSTDCVCATPSAATGSSIRTTWRPQATALLTATDWRCPPDMSSTGNASDGIRIWRRETMPSASRSICFLFMTRIHRRPGGSLR